MILAIDPGNIESAYVVVKDDLSEVIDKGKINNEDLLHELKSEFVLDKTDHIAIEMIASYGMAVGKTVFDTCVWIGRFYETCIEEYGITPIFVYRMEEKIALCHDPKAKDTNIRQALIDRFGVVGTKNNQGYFYGFKKDIWQAMAVAVTYHDRYLNGCIYN